MLLPIRPFVAGKEILTYERLNTPEASYGKNGPLDAYSDNNDNIDNDKFRSAALEEWTTNNSSVNGSYFNPT